MTAGLLPFAILALNTSSTDQDLKTLHEYGIGCCKRLQFVYDGGDSEVAYLIPLMNEQQEQEILTLAKIYNQEAVMMVGDDMQARLVNPLLGTDRVLGTLRCVDPAYAKVQYCHVYDPSTQAHWVAD